MAAAKWALSGFVDLNPLFDTVDAEYMFGVGWAIEGVGLNHELQANTASQIVNIILFEYKRCVNTISMYPRHDINILQINSFISKLTYTDMVFIFCSWLHFISIIFKLGVF